MLDPKRLKYEGSPRILKCVFCGASDTLSNEHVFSRWSHRLLSADRSNEYESLRGTRNPHDREEHIVKRAGDIRDWQVKCVCVNNCNNGWMRRDIEEKAKPILIPLIKGDTVRLSPEDQRIVATWATMKAMIAEWGQKGHVTTHHTQRKRLMRKHEPPKSGWGIWIGLFDSSPQAELQYATKWESHPILILPDVIAARRKSKKATYFNSHTSTQVIGRLLIQTVRSPMPNLVPRWHFKTPDSGTLFRIWPAHETSILWPAKALSDRDALYTANALIDFIIAIQKKRGVG